jgi:hypothetical protein
VFWINVSPPSLGSKNNQSKKPDEEGLLACSSRILDNFLSTTQCYIQKQTKKINSVALARERTIVTERLLLVSEVSANFL